MMPGEQFDEAAPSLEPVAGPWARYAARVTDLMLVASALSIADGILGLRMSRLPETAQSIVVGLVWMPLEAILLASAGTTPGKTLYGLTVLDSGRGIPIGKAALRSWMVLMLGMGFCVRGLTVIALILNFWSLSKSGATPWDRASGCVERLRPLSLRRIVVAVLVTSGLAYIVAQGGWAGWKPPRVTSRGTQHVDLARPHAGPRRPV